MRLRIAAVASLFLAGTSGAVGAPKDPETGAYLLEQCRKASDMKSAERWNREFCVGFVSGYVEGHRQAGGDAFCLPEDASTGKMVSAVVHYLEAHSEALDLPRGEALAAALRDRYPCGTAKP